MKIVSVSKSIRYIVTDGEGEEHCFSVWEGTKNTDNPYIVIAPDPNISAETIEIPLTEIPFFVKALNLFLEESSYGKK